MSFSIPAQGKSCNNNRHYYLLNDEKLAILTWSQDRGAIAVSSRYRATEFLQELDRKEAK